MSINDPVIAGSVDMTPVTSASSAICDGGGGGGKGDYLDHLNVVPDSATGVGNVTIKDGAGSAVTVWNGGSVTATGGAYPVQLGMYSKSGGWTVSCGAKLTAQAFGKFT